MRNQIAVVSTPQTQQVATRPSHAVDRLAQKLFGGTSKQPEQAIAQTKRAATPGQIAEWRSTIAKQETADRAELAARMKPEHVAVAQRTFARWKSPQLETYLRETGQGANLWAHDMIGRMGMHIEALEAEIAALRTGRR